MPSTTVPNGTPKSKAKPAYDPAFTDRGRLGLLLRSGVLPLNL